MRSRVVWNLSKMLFLIVGSLAFTPLVIPRGESMPMLFGLPRTLWAGLVVSVLLLAVIALGAWATGPLDGKGPE